MIEDISTPIDSAESARKQKKEKIIALATELAAHQERFPFPGIEPGAYSRMKADQEQFPGYCTPIDELIERFKREGMKIMLGEHPESGNVFIVPTGSNDIENDSIFPKHLQLDGSMDEKLKQLILMGRR